MRDELANVIYPVLTRGLAVKERLERGEPLDLAEEQGRLKGLLSPQLEGARSSDFAGEVGLDSAGQPRAGDSIRRVEPFLGARYALVCWLDEVFILESPWGDRWSEVKLETALYGSNERAWRFWEQARRAESRPGGDALEAFYLCVMLGFRGELREQPDKLRAWIQANQGRVAKGQSQDCPMPPERDPPTNVPPLRGREQLQRMLLLGGALLLLLLPLATLLVVLHYSAR